MPSEENDSNKIVLRGPKDKIGDAAGAGMFLLKLNLFKY